MQRIKMERGCERCGYNEHPAALQFHHRDPGQKLGLVPHLANGRLWRFRAEVEKCDVLCANCHAVETATTFSEAHGVNRRAVLRTDEAISLDTLF